MRASTQDGSYPRPQLLRERWTDLGGEWEFAHDDNDCGLAAHWESTDGFSRRIQVPFAPESVASGIGDNGLHPVVWYRRLINIDPSSAPGRRFLLHFGGVDYSADIWVDGTHVGAHRGGQTAFTLDITNALDARVAEHTLVVRVHDDPAAVELPRGKQDWHEEPHFIWYRRTTGIWKPVWLEDVDPVHIVAVSWLAAADQAGVRAEIELTKPIPEDTRVTVDLWRGSHHLAGTIVRALDNRVTAYLDVAEWRNAQERERSLWAPDNPVLVDASLSVTVGGRSVDEVASYIGVRSAAVGDRAFLLNGRPYFVRAVLEQGYWEQSQLTAPNPQAYRREVELIKALGFNTVRIHQKVEDPRFLFWADRLGLAVWAEMAAAYEFTPTAAQALLSEWVDTVQQQRNHPCVITWVPVNESWGVEELAARSDQCALVTAVTALTRALDPTRPVVSNDGWEHVDSDILTVHDYTTDTQVLGERWSSDKLPESLDGIGPAGRRLIVTDAMRQRLSSSPVMVSEFGGISFSQAGTWGYQVVADPDEYERKLRAVFDVLNTSRMIAGFCYTQLTDTLQESNGLLTADREPKIALATIRSIVEGTCHRNEAAALPPEAVRLDAAAADAETVR